MSDHEAALAAQYSAEPGALNQASTDRTLTIAPPPLAPRIGANARHMASGPRTLVSNSLLRHLGGVVGQGARAGADTSIVDEQRHVAAPRAAASMSFVEVMSSRIGSTPSIVTEKMSRAPAYTFDAPRSSNDAQSDLPSPRLAPVTRATDPVMSMIPLASRFLDWWVTPDWATLVP